jgi:hypothetical protein
MTIVPLFGGLRGLTMRKGGPNAASTMWPRRWTRWRRAAYSARTTAKPIGTPSAEATFSSPDLIIAESAIRCPDDVSIRMG